MLRRDATGQTAERRNDEQEHAETKVDQPAAQRGTRDGSRRGNDGHQADACGLLNGQAHECGEERDEEDAASKPEQRADAAGSGAHDRHERDRQCFHGGSSAHRPNGPVGRASLTPPAAVSSARECRNRHHQPVDLPTFRAHERARNESCTGDSPVPSCHATCMFPPHWRVTCPRRSARTSSAAVRPGKAASTAATPVSRHMA